MKKIILGILMLFLVALVPSVSAAVVDCSAAVGNLGDLEVTDVTFDSVGPYEPGTNVNVDLEVTNNGASDITLTLSSSVIELYVYDGDGTLISGDYPISLTLASNLVVQVDDDATIEDALWTVDPMDYLAYNYDNEHNYVFYVRVMDNSEATATQCDVSDGNDIVIDNYPRLRNINAQTAVEDDEFRYESSSALATDADNEVDEPIIDTLTYDLDTISKAKGMSIGSSTGIITWTPRNEHSSLTHTVEVKVSDGYAEDTETFTIFVTNTNDAPVLPAIGPFYVQDELAVSSFVILTDSEDANVDVDESDSVTYSLDFDGVKPEDSTFSLSYFNPITRTISGWTPDKDDIGELNLRLIANDGEANPVSQDFTINVYPKAMCEDALFSGDDLSLELSKPDDGDDFGPGDTIIIEATVENDYKDKDIILKAILYDVENHKKIVEVESDDENIDEDDSGYEFKLELQVPLDNDEEYGADYVIYVKAYEDDKEDEQCLSDSVEVNIKRESHDVIVQSLTMTPLEAEAGDEVDVTVRVANIGKKDEEGVFVKLRNTELDIDLTSDAKDLAKYSDSGNTYTFQFKGVELPSDADTDEYDFEVFVVYEGGSTSTSWMDSPNYKIGSATVAVEASASDVVDTTGDTVVDTVDDSDGFPWGTVLWIIGDVVLIIVAIFFIKLIFSARKKRPKVKEVKL